MQPVITGIEPEDEVLLSEGDITVTHSRIDVENKTYALRYISSVSLHESHPPRGEARFVIIVALCALVMSVVYGVLDKVTLLGFLIFFLASVVALVIGVLVYWMDPSKYYLILKLIDGEKIEVGDTSEAFVQRVHNALTTSLARNRFSTATFPVASAAPAINSESSAQLSSQQPT